jgi:hypothetical protein
MLLYCTLPISQSAQTAGNEGPGRLTAMSRSRLPKIFGRMRVGSRQVGTPWGNAKKLPLPLAGDGWGGGNGRAASDCHQSSRPGLLGGSLSFIILRRCNRGGAALAEYRTAQVLTDGSRRNACRPRMQTYDFSCYNCCGGIGFEPVRGTSKSRHSSPRPMLARSTWRPRVPPRARSKARLLSSCSLSFVRCPLSARRAPALSQPICRFLCISCRNLSKSCLTGMWRRRGRCCPSTRPKRACAGSTRRQDESRAGRLRGRPSQRRGVFPARWFRLR